MTKAIRIFHGQFHGRFQHIPKRLLLAGCAAPAGSNYRFRLSPSAAARLRARAAALPPPPKQPASINRPHELHRLQQPWRHLPLRQELRGLQQPGGDGGGAGKQRDTATGSTK